MLTAAELLRDAADILETDGWTQRQLGSPIEGWCTIGAIFQAADNTDTTGKATGDALQTVRATIATSNITHWNDHPSRTKTEVIDTLRTAADTLTKDH